MVIDDAVLGELDVGEHNFDISVNGKDIEIRILVRLALDERRQAEILSRVEPHYLTDPADALQCHYDNGASRIHCQRDATTVVVCADGRLMTVCAQHAATCLRHLPRVRVPYYTLRLARAELRRGYRPDPADCD
jgi:hypothetical protein